MYKFRRQMFQKLVSAQLIGIMVLCAGAVSLNCYATENNSSNKTTDTVQYENSDNEYYDYYNSNIDIQRINSTVELNEADIISKQGTTEISNIEGIQSVVINDGDYAEWKFNVSEDGLYPLTVDYYATEGSGKDLLLSLYIDGGLPFSEAREILLHRIWYDDDIKDDKFNTDSYGNDLLPKQAEIHMWSTATLKNNTGLFKDPYLFNLKKGEHTIRIKMIQEGIAISKLTFGSSDSIPTYSEYIKNYGKNDYAKGEAYIKQAEMPVRKNKSTLYPLSDRTTTATVPYDAVHTKLNTIGQGNWASTGEYITWKVDVSKKGLYKILFRARQSYNEGMNSYRTLYVNGKIPFEEASEISFSYKSDWYGMELGNGKPYYVYLEPGDEITLEVTTGSMSEALCGVKESTYKLNELYRRIIVITGTSPDAYRDYALEKKIPGLVDEINSTKAILEKTSAGIKKLIGDKGSQASAIDRSIAILADFSENPYNITAKLSSFKDNIENLGTLVQTLSKQPLELDYIAFIPPQTDNPRVTALWYKDFTYNLSKFFISFVNDYTKLGGSTDSKGEKSIEVWVSTGRDQAQVINNMITDTFTYKTGVSVNLSMVSTGNILIQATLAGMGPHAAISVGHEEPVNLAMRGALVNLADKKYDLETVKKEFFDSAWTPFEYNGGVYAMPETQGFDMMFYRTDIFDELNIKAPVTWDDFYIVLKVLQENNLLFGIPEINSANAGVSAGVSTFDKFLFQNGGKYYNDKLNATLFDTEVGYSAFEKWVNLYSRYGLDREFDFYNRFRSGEMPAGIQPYTMYNKLVEAAPEIRGLWDFTIIPGTVDDKGNVNHAESSSGTGCMVLKKAVKDNVDSEAFDFLKWWVSADTQTRYCQELEAMMGTAARGTPANVEAFRRLNWTKEETGKILAQWEYVCNPQQIPGNYTVSRSLTNAFRAALNDNQNARRYLQIYNKDINNEITRKRKEFKLD